ncbi:MAG: PAS domain S-box protein, partial [Pelolinea sp.]|nr:PAS domain S-box protein [Pelolinea sp.]
MSIPIKLLHIEDSKADHELIMRELREGGFDVTAELVDSQDAVRAAFTRAGWDVIISDFRLPGFTGDFVLDLYRQNHMDIPLIICSGTIGEEKAVAMMQIGLKDFVLKDNMVRLPAAIKRELKESAIYRAGRESETRYHNLVDNALVGIFQNNLKGEFVFANAKLVKMLGYKDKAKVISSRMVDHCKNSQDCEKMLALLKKDGYISDFEVELLTLTGQTITTLMNITLEGENFSGMLLDITERKQAEEALTNEKEKAQKYLDIAEVMIVAFDQKGDITLVNQKGAGILGYGAEELIGRNWFNTCIPEVDRKQLKKLHAEFMAGGAGLGDHCEQTVITKSGKERIIDWRSTPLWEGDQKVRIGSLSSGEDITKQVRAERLLNALNQASVAMGAVLTPQEVFNTIAKELKQLDISCMLFPLDDTGDKLTTQYLSYESAFLDAVEKLVGMNHADFSFPIDTVDLYREVVRHKKSLFIDNLEQITQQVLPKFAKKFSAKIVNILHAQRGIFAPLIVEDQVIGVFSIQSDALISTDVPTATAFAHELAGAWNKTKLVQDLRKTVEGTIHTIAATVEIRDPYTAGHQKRVSELAATIASEMHLTEQQVEGVRMAGLIHDLGKIQVPAEILSKPGQLSEIEFQIIQTHPQVGYDLLKEIEFPWPIAQMVYQHHEKMNGSGYPQGLKGDEILLEARILAVADIVEAMSSHRPYRPALGIEKA